ncbi:MAG: DivIVA domain-containing protein [Rhodoglobus sp.]
MALTPEDVVNKRFESTKFREGYDQDDVDDFLDEIVVELRRLNHENEELRQQLTAAESRSHELQQAAISASANAAPAVAAPVAAVATDRSEAASAAQADDTASANNLLQLARRLHEEHVREGVAKRDALIAEGTASAAEIVAEAKSQHREQLDSFKHEREAIESRIESLRSFESEYRQKLKSYIEEQLHELDSNTLVSPAPTTPRSAPQNAAPVGRSAGHLSPDDFATPQSAQQPPARFTGFSGN